jgi:alpha-D-ribose 1-methylphosphonate 5-triphosphate synthase subunit PhnI
MGYTAIKGGADAIRAAEILARAVHLAADESPLDTRQLDHQLTLAIDKIMGEGGLYAPELAALALKQAHGDLFEAAFLLRAYRSTLPRLGYSLPARGDMMRVVRRISSAFKDIPGGQLLGQTLDYTQRLLDFSLLGSGVPVDGDVALGGLVNGHAGTNGHAVSTGTASNGAASNGTATKVKIGPDGGPAVAPAPTAPGELAPRYFPKVADAMRAAGLVATPPAPDPNVEPPDITLESMRFPVSRPAYLQALARGESGAMLCLAYSGMRGYGGGNHGTLGELRVGDLPLKVVHPLTGQPVTIGWYRATEVEMLGQEHDATRSGRKLARFDLSYGLVFGQHERKAISMALLDSTLRPTAADGDGHEQKAPARDQEMVLYHIDGIESAGFVEHLKLPHYVTFGSTLQSALTTDEAAPLETPTTNGAATDPLRAPAIAQAGRTDGGAAGEDDHEGVSAGQLHHHGDGVLHAHDD